MEAARLMIPRATTTTPPTDASDRHCVVVLNEAAAALSVLCSTFSLQPTHGQGCGQRRRTLCMASRRRRTPSGFGHGGSHGDALQTSIVCRHAELGSQKEPDLVWAIFSVEAHFSATPRPHRECLRPSPAPRACQGSRFRARGGRRFIATAACTRKVHIKC